MQNGRRQARCCRPRASRARHFGFTRSRRVRDATDHYGAGDKRVGPYDCGPCCPADSRLRTGIACALCRLKSEQFDSGDDKGTIRSAVRLPRVSDDVRRYRLMSISYISLLPCDRLPTHNRSGIRCFLAEHTFSPPILSYIRTGCCTQIRTPACHAGQRVRVPSLPPASS